MAARKKSKDSFGYAVEQAKAKREAAWKRLWEMPRYSKARETYERLLRQETRAEGMWLATKREVDRLKYDRARRQRERFGRAINAYEDRELARDRSRTTERKRKKKSSGVYGRPENRYNLYGLTYQRWITAARVSPSTKHRAAWRAGEDPSDYRATRSRSTQKRRKSSRLRRAPKRRRRA